MLFVVFNMKRKTKYFASIHVLIILRLYQVRYLTYAKETNECITRQNDSMMIGLGEIEVCKTINWPEGDFVSKRYGYIV